MTDLEQQLRQYVETAFAEVPETTAADVVDGSRPVRYSASRRWPVAVAAAIVLALVAVIAVIEIDDPEHSYRLGTSPRPNRVATNTDPLPSAAGEWTVDLGGEIPYAPVVVDGAVVVVTVDPGSDRSAATVIALEADGGAEDSTVASRRWSVDLGSPVVSQPVVAKDTILFRLAADRLIAVGADDGVVRWSVETGSGGDGPPAPVVSGATAYVGSTDGLVQAVRLRDGTLRWSRDLEGGVLAPPTPVAQGLLVTATEMPVGSGGGALYVLDERGRVVERYRSAFPTVTSPAGRGGIVAFATSLFASGATPQADPTELVIGGRRGKVRHRFHAYLSAPVVTDAYVAVASDAGVLRAYDNSDPDRRLWSADVGANQGPQLMVRDGRLIATGANVVAIDPTNGDERWTAAVPDAFFGQSDDANRIVAISRTRGSLAVVDVRDGSLVVDFALRDAPPGAVLHDGTLVWTGTGGVVTTARVGADPPVNVRAECATSSAGRAPNSGNGLTDEAAARSVFDEIKASPPRVDGADVVNVRLEPDASVSDGWRIVVTVSSVSACPAEIVIVNGVRIWFDAMR